MANYEQQVGKPVAPVHDFATGADRLTDFRVPAKADVPISQGDRSPSFSAQQVGSLIDTSTEFGNYTTANRVLARAVQNAYDQGGRSSADQFVTDVNGATRTDGVGPIITSQNGKPVLHLAQETGRLTDQQQRSGEYFQEGNRWFHDLAKPTEISTQARDNAEQARIAQQQTERTQQIQDSVRTLMSDPEFVRTGRMSEATAQNFGRTLGSHDHEMPQFIQAVNQELARQGSRASMSVDIALNQPGMHGNTVTMYHVRSIDTRSGKPVQGFTSGHDTVRDIGGAPPFKWDN